MTVLNTKKLYHEGLLPEYAHEGDAGMDLHSTETFRLYPRERRLVPTGIAVAIPDGYAGFVQPRSGLAVKSGVTVLNTPGLIDSGYRGEIKVCLINLGTQPVDFKIGSRIAQLVVLPVARVDVRKVDDLDDTERGADGFGSTGME